MNPAVVHTWLARCEDILARHLAAAVDAYGSAALDVIDLPSFATSAIDADALRIAAVLWWTCEVEQAGLPVFTERLAEAVANGGLIIDLGAATGDLMAWWRSRDQRFSLEERHALYRRLFGDGSGFPAAIARLVDLLDDLGRARQGEPLGAYAPRLAVAGSDLAEPLARAATGMAAFAARDITAQIRTSLDLLTHPDLDRALGGQGPWTAIRLHGAVLLGRTPDVPMHLARARAGHQLLTWLADNVQGLEAGHLSAAPGDVAVSAAQALLAADATAPASAEVAWQPAG